MTRTDRWVRTEWPEWPEIAPRAEEYTRAAIRSRRWAISSRNNGNPLFERRFAEAFAEFTRSRHCIPTDHGSSALLIALEALGLEAGSEVVVPAMTWVATATAVFRAGLCPVLADVDPATGCLTPETVEACVTPRTGAVIVVHWAAAMTDMPDLLRLTDRLGLPVIEDASQAHGASWLDRRAGTFGVFGCFSMQHAKVLTCGEGGALVTDRDDLRQTLEELRADSRSYRESVRTGRLDLAETASTMGANLGLGEVSAALLLAQLEHFPDQHRRRNTNYALLQDGLAAADAGVRLLRRDPDQTEVSPYEVVFVFDHVPESTVDLAARISARLGVDAYPPRVPLGRSALLRPGTKRAYADLATRFARSHEGVTWPGADHLAATSVVLHHSVLLACDEQMELIVDAVGETAREASCVHP